MSRGRVLSKVGGLTQTIAGISTFVGVSTFASDVRIHGKLDVDGDISYDEMTSVNSKVTGVSTATDIRVDRNLNVAGIATFANALPNSQLANSTVSFGGVSVALGAADATPAFNLADATGYPTSSLSGTITNAQLAGSITNGKLIESTVSYGGISLELGASDATPAFDLSDATNYPTTSLSGTITNAQLAGSIANAKLANSTVSFGGISLALGASDATPAFDLSDATDYPTSSLVGTITNAQLAGSIASSKLANSGVSAGTVGSSTAIPIITVNAQGQITSTSTTAIDSTTIENGTASVAVASNGPITSTGNHDFTAGIDVTGNITVSGTVDGRDVATDGTKLDGIESAATADQTAAEIRTLVDSATDSNVFTDALASKLSGIEASATADQTAAEIRTLVEGATDSNVFTDADHTKLNGIESNATADQTDEEIQDIVGAMLSGNTESGITVTYQDADGTIDFTVASQTDENFTTADHAKLDGIESGATADQSDSEIKTAYENNSDTNALTDALLSKLNAIEAGATADQTSEEIQDIVGAMVSSNTESGITVTYQDADGTIDFAVASQTDENFTTADHSKLDGIEAGATADQTASEILTLIKTVDGSGSGLDADTLDGVSSASFLRSDTNDTFTGTLTVSGSASVDNLSLDGNTVTTSSGNLTIDSAGGTTTLADNVAISGNLTVNGTTTTVNATTVNIADKNIQVATGAADDAAADGGGITVDSGDGDKTFQFEATGDNFGSSENMNLASGKAYKINNTSVLNATTLGSNVVASSLTSVGTIATGVWQGTAIANAYLANSTTSVGGVTLTLGGTDATPAFNLSDATNYPTSSLSGTITNAQLAGSIASSKLASTGVSAGTVGSGSAIPVITVNAQGQITGTSTAAIDSTAISEGNSSMTVDDSGTGTIVAAIDGSTLATFAAAGITLSSGAFVGNLTGNVTGNTSGSSGSCTGNAATATKLAATKTIAGVAFDGSANISLNNNAITNGAGYITSSGTSAACSGNSATATLAANSTITANNSTDETVYPVFVDGATGTQGLESDTGLSFNPSTNTLTTTTFVGALTGNVTGNASGSSGSCTGNAATATILATARSIAGVSFDGSQDISLNNANITNGAGYVTANTQLSNEQVQDIVGAMLTGNTETGITVTYQDGDGTIDFAVADTSETASSILTKIKTVDGAGSGLDADSVDGIAGASLLRSDTADAMTATLTAYDIVPASDSSYDLGTNSVRWANVYADDVRTGDLHLSNEHRGGNTIDGSWGHYTIEEGEDDLFIMNKRSGKKFRFVLEQL